MAQFPASAEQLMLLAALQAGHLPQLQLGIAPPPLGTLPLPPHPQASPSGTPSGGAHNRQRAPTNFRGVTRTSGSATGAPRVQLLGAGCRAGRLAVGEGVGGRLLAGVPAVGLAVRVLAVPPRR